jgi:hypothetical protein
VRADFELIETEVGYTSFDAFGGDLVQGRIERCAFHDVLGNGLDLAGSDVTVQDTNLLRIYGQGVVGGRGSLIVVQGVRADDVGIAIASRDMSSVNAQDVYVSRAWVTALAAYLEELAYGPAHIQASRIVFGDDSARALTHGGSTVIFDEPAVAVGTLDMGQVGRRRQMATEMHIVDYLFGVAVRLVGYDLLTPQPASGESLQFVLYWQALAELDRDYTIFVHLLDQTGRIAAQWDAMPRENSFPTTAWTVGEIVDDMRLVPLPMDLPAGEYQIAVGVYYAPTEARLPVRGPNGEPIPGAVVLLGQRVLAR